MTAVALTTEKRRKPVDYVGIGLWVALVVTSLLWALPFAVMLFTSLKTNADISSAPSWAPSCSPPDAAAPSHRP